MSEKNISEQNMNGLKMLIDTFIRSDTATREIQPTMWLSVIDFTSRIGMDDLCDYSREIFYNRFQWEDLLTTSGSKKENDKEGSGRNFNRSQRF